MSVFDVFFYRFWLLGIFMRLEKMSGKSGRSDILFLFRYVLIAFIASPLLILERPQISLLIPIASFMLSFVYFRYLF